MPSIAIPTYPTESFDGISPDSIGNPKIIAAFKRLHPTDWPTPIVHRLFELHDPLPNEDPLQLGTVPPPSTGDEEVFDYFELTVKSYYEFDRPRNLMTVLHAFIHWLNDVRHPFGHTRTGISFNIFGKEHGFRTPMTMAHVQRPFLTVIDEEARRVPRKVPLTGKWAGLRVKEAEYGICGHDFAVLLQLIEKR